MYTNQRPTESPSLSPWGRVALLGIAQRKIRASRGHIGTNRRPRKSLPTTVKTLGDRIQVCRYEKGLLQSELAEKMGITIEAIQLLENDLRVPKDKEWQMLETILAPGFYSETLIPNG